MPTDELRVSIGSTIQERISGETTWSQVVLPIPAGSQAIRWEYAKDNSFNEDQDRGWVDEIQFSSRARPVISYPTSVGIYVGQPFEVMPEAVSTATSFTLGNEAPNWITINTTTGELSGNAPVSRSVSVSVTGESSSGTSAAISISIDTAGLDSLASGWQWAGTMPWTTQTTQTSQTHDGVDALRSGPVGDNAFSDLHISIVGPAIVRFWWCVDSEESHDKLSFRIDEIVAQDVSGAIAEIHGLKEWERRVIAVPTGHHVITWRYDKDARNVLGEDAGWLDEVEIIDSRDHDSDGLSSLVEACLGLDWNQTSADNLPLPAETDGRLSWQVTKGADLGGIFPIIEISYNLETWSAVPLESLNDTASDLMVREREQNTSLRKFIRLRASTSPE